MTLVQISATLCITPLNFNSLNTKLYNLMELSHRCMFIPMKGPSLSSTNAEDSGSFFDVLRLENAGCAGW